MQNPYPYTLTLAQRQHFENIWREQIRFFPECPHVNPDRVAKAKSFAAKVYAAAMLPVEEKQTENSNVVGSETVENT